MFSNIYLLLANAFGYSLWGNSLGLYLVALLALVLAILALQGIKAVALKQLNKKEGRFKKERKAAAQAIQVIGWPLYLLIGFYLVAAILDTGAWFSRLLHWLTIILVTYYFIRILQALVDYAVDRFVSTRRAKGEGTSASAIKLLGRIVKGLLWAVGLIIVLQNLGYNISALAAGLGIGGLAVAFALQNILADFFASFSIYFDRPFEVGDFIVIGSDRGVVEHIGIKSTRLKTLEGQELVVSNRELTESRVHNYRKMGRRRIVFEFGVEYSTPHDKLVKIPDLIKDIISHQEMAEVDRVHFKELGPYSLNFEVVYYVNDQDYNLYMNIQQMINLEMKEKFDQEKIVFAFPRQDICLVK